MTAAAFPFLLALLVATGEPIGAGAEAVAAPLLVVGEQVSFEPFGCLPYPGKPIDEDPDNTEAKNARCSEDDLQYRARYRVRTPVEGDAGDSVEFLATGWTSHYANSRHALLYLVATPEGWVLPPGLAIEVYPTTDGSWASCDEDGGNGPVEFAGDLPFGRTDGMSPYGIAQRYPAKDYVVVGKEAFCIRGRRLPALLKTLDYEREQLRRQGYAGLPGREDQAAKP